MMGNVAGVGQLLETVGVPVTQAGTDSSVPGHDFASALQQAGGPSAQELAGPGTGQEGAETGTKNPASGTGQTAAAQSGDVKTADAGKSGATQQHGRAGLVEKTPGGARVVVGRGLSATPVPANFVGSKPVELTPGKPGGVAVVADATTGGDSKAAKDEIAAVALSGTVVSEPGVSEPVKGQAGTASVPVRNMSEVQVLLKNAVPRPAVAKAGEEGAAQSAKPAGKAGSAAAVDSKLTALSPQGIVDPAQGPALAVAAAPPAQAAAAAPPVVTETANASGRPVLVAALDASTATNALAVPIKAAAVQTANGKPPHKAAPEAMTGAMPETVASASAPTFEKASPQGEVSASVPASTITGGLVGTAAPVAKTVAVASKTAAVPVAAQANAGPAAQVTVQTVAATAEIPVQTNAGFQAALQTTAASGPNTAKTGQHGGRSFVTAVRAGDPAISASGAGAGQVEEARTFVAAAAPAVSAPAAVKTSAAVPLATRQTGAVESEPKAGIKAEDVPAPAAVPPASGKGTVATAGPSGAVAPAKDAPAMGSAQPAALPVEPVAGLALGAAISVPVAHEAGVGGATVSAAGDVAGLSSGAGTGAGTHESGGAAGLAHTTLSATPTSLEVGVSSGTHGWLKIRAELNAAGTVDASLTGTSAASAERLRTELPGLNNFLLNERVAMGSLDVRSAAHSVVAAGESSATFSQAGSGQGSSGQGGNPQGNTAGNLSGLGTSADTGSAGGQAQQQASRGGGTIPVVNGVGAVDEVVLGRVSDAALYGSSMELGDNAAASSVGYGAGGGWLNVRA